MTQQRTESAPIPATPEKDKSSAALRAFFKIAEAWKLNTEDQMTLLGSPPRSTYFKFKKEGGNLPTDTMERISYILGIYKALQILLPDTAAADEWVRQPNSASIFNGQSALDRMLGGRVADLYVVRGYLDAQRGG
jgi:hypothetical protein